MKDQNFIQNIIPYIRYKTSRSSGSGGQNVNKVASKVELLFNFNECVLFNEDEKALIRTKLSNRIQADGLLQIISQESRSQLENKEIAIEKLVSLLAKALQVNKSRKKTKPSKRAVQKRLDSKRRQALKKINRKLIDRHD
jgi:ribosome-associated protein